MQLIRSPEVIESWCICGEYEFYINPNKSRRKFISLLGHYSDYFQYNISIWLINVTFSYILVTFDQVSNI